MDDAGARRAFLADLIDDAGLFPPALLSMDDALAAHAAHRAGPYGWMLGRFLCPASRLGELPDGLRVGVIDDGADVPADDRLVIETYEAKLGAVRRPPPGAAVYLEAADSTEVAGVVEMVDVAAERGTGAKLRCGGDTPARYPSPDVVAAFVVRAHERGVGCKATAGLHHPVRRDHEHGFLNLVGAAALLTAEAIEPNDVTAVIAENDPTVLRLDADGFTWRDRAADGPAIDKARRHLFHAYGSCSFTEPVDDLRALAIL